MAARRRRAQASQLGGSQLGMAGMTQASALDGYRLPPSQLSYAIPGLGDRDRGDGGARGGAGQAPGDPALAGYGYGFGGGGGAFGAPATQLGGWQQARPACSAWAEKAASACLTSSTSRTVHGGVAACPPAAAAPGAQRASVARAQTQSQAAPGGASQLPLGDGFTQLTGGSQLGGPLALPLGAFTQDALGGASQGAASSRFGAGSAALFQGFTQTARPSLLQCGGPCLPAMPWCATTRCGRRRGCCGAACSPARTSLSVRARPCVSPFKHILMQAAQATQPD
jgi:hypothetical protein